MAGSFPPSSHAAQCFEHAFASLILHLKFEHNEQKCPTRAMDFQGKFAVKDINRNIQADQRM